MVGWNHKDRGWQRGRRPSAAELGPAGGWTMIDVASLVVAVVIRWELAVAFLALKLWQQASGSRGSAFAFARDRWEALVGATRSLLGNGTVPSLHIGPRSSGNHAFDRWRRTELTRIEAEREKLRGAERDFAAYRDELLHAKDRDDFERFMQARQMGADDPRPELRRSDRA